MKNALMINFGGIGDEILFLPAIESFKKEFPNCKVTLCVEPRSKCIKDLCPLIDDLILVDIKRGNKYLQILNMIKQIRKRHFDVVISSGKSPFIAIILFLCGIKKRYGYDSGRISKILLTKAVKLNENQYAAKMYHDLVAPLTKNITELPRIEVEAQKMPKTVLIHPGVSKMSIEKNINKNWKTQNWRILIEQILKKGYQVILAGGPDDEEVIKEIGEINHPNFENVYGKTKNIIDLARLIKSSQYTICADSAPMHISVALNTKTFGIFGPTNEKKLLPENENFIAVENNISCRPCLWHKRITSCENPVCLDIDLNMILDEL